MKAKTQKQIAAIKQHAGEPARECQRCGRQLYDGEQELCLRCY